MLSAADAGAEPSVAAQLGEPGADRAGWTPQEIERWVERIEDTGLGVAELVGVGYGDGDDAQAGADPG